MLALLSDGIYEYCNAAGAQFGEERVEAVLLDHHGLSMAELASRLLAAVERFAQGAPQEDDITVVLVKREAAADAAFARTFDSLPSLADFTARFFARHRVDPALLHTIDLAVEELFTNMVKYSPGGAARVEVGIATVAGGVRGGADRL